MSNNRTSGGNSNAGTIGGVVGGTVAGAVIGFLAAGAVDAPPGPQPQDYMCWCAPGSGGDPDKATPVPLQGPVGSCPHQDIRNNLGCDI